MDDDVVTTIPLFPLRSVLCPGVALPLHIFEDRYRLMVSRCLQRGEPFGVVLIREGREVGPLSGSIAAIGTTAAIRQAGRYPDGRYEILTVGQQRFHLESVDADSEPYLVGHVSFLEEPIGPEQEARQQAEQVGQRFLKYLQLLQPVGDGEGPEIQIEFEVEVDETDVDDAPGSVIRSCQQRMVRRIHGRPPARACANPSRSAAPCSRDGAAACATTPQPRVGTPNRRTRTRRASPLLATQPTCRPRNGVNCS